MATTITLVQQASMVSSTPSVAITLNGVAQGNTLTVPFVMGGATPGLLSITDNNGNEWNFSIVNGFLAVSEHLIGIASAVNVNAGNTTVTLANLNGGPAVASMQEWNVNIPGAYLVPDQTNFATGTGTSPASGNITTGFAPEAIIGMMFNTTGGFTGGAGWTGLTNLLSAEYPQYQISASTGTFNSNGTCTSGTWASSICSFRVYTPPFNVNVGRFLGGEIAPISSAIIVGKIFAPIWGLTNVSPVTVNANVSSDQLLMSEQIPANTLNTVGRTLKVFGAGVFSTPAASTSAITFKIQLGSLTLVAITTAALGALQATNNPFNFEFYITTSTAGSSAEFETHGNLVIDLGAGNTVAATIYPDENTAASSTLDSTINELLQVTIAFSGASASNTATQRLLVLRTEN